MELEPMVYPHRDWIEAGKCGYKPIQDLRTCVLGGTFHKYGVRGCDKGSSVEEELQRMQDVPGMLKFTGKLGSGSVEFGVLAFQAGDLGSWVSSQPHLTAEDAAYAVLTLIEEHEREEYVKGLVMGLS